jgi:hypothetical protein
MSTESNGKIHIPTASRPADAELRTSYRIVRAPTTGELSGLVLNQEIYGCDTHYFHGRTRPHTEPICEACDEGAGKRWQGYLGLLLTKSRDLVLFEFTAAAAAPLVEYYEHNRGLNGAMIRAYRTSMKANARVVIRIERGDTDLFAAPKAPNVAEILTRIWGIDRLLAHEAQRAEAIRNELKANPQPGERQKS